MLHLNNCQIGKLKGRKNLGLPMGSLPQLTKETHIQKKIRKTDNQLFFIRYKCYRDKINHLIRKIKDYYCKNFNSCRQNIRKIWQQIRVKIIIHKSKNKDYVTCIKTEKGIISDPFATENKFNAFYISVASKLVSKIKKKSHHKLMDPKKTDSIFLQPTNKSEIENIIIKSLDSNKSSDIWYVTKIPENTGTCNI